MGIAAVAIFGYLAFFHKELGNQFGSTAIPTQQNAESATISMYASESIATIGTFFMGGHNTDTPTIAQYASVGTCADATTTVVSVQNPFSATSTMRFVALSGTDGTSTIKIFAGTSTTPSVTNQASKTVFNTANIATSTGFYTSVDSTAGTATFVSANNGGFTSIIVGPSEYILVSATSTTGSAADQAAITQTGNTFSCTYEMLWTK